MMLGTVTREMEMSTINNNYDSLRELILIEEFKLICLSNDTRTLINDQKAKTLNDATRWADNFSLTHKFSTPTKKTNTTVTFRNNYQNDFDNKRFPKPISHFRDETPTIVPIHKLTSRENNSRSKQLSVIIVSERAHPKSVIR